MQGENSSSNRLLSILGVTFGLAVIVGNTIGAGILRTPGDIAAHLPNFWAFMGVWVVGGIYALLGSNALAELGAMLPRTGGQYVFARHALGTYAGFIVGWSDWLSTCGSAAAISIVIGEYSTDLLPSLKGMTVPIALVALFLFALVQWRGMRWGSRSQELTSLLKALAFILLIAACFVAFRRSPLDQPAVRTDSSSMLLAIVLSLQAIIYTYDGWSGVIYFSEEVKDPGRDIPRSIFGGVAAVMVIYLLVNIGFLMVVPLAKIAHQPFAAGVVANEIFGPAGNVVIRLIVVVSMLSAVNACLLMATRVLFAMSRDGLFTERVARVNAGGTPAPALLVSLIVAVAFALSGTFDRVIALLAFFFIANYALSFVSLFVLRAREPQRPRPFRAWGHPWTTGLALAASVAFLIGAAASDTRNTLWSLVLLAASFPVYLLMRRHIAAK
ncbi:MAG: APC family permease [Acidobacteriota bacterium]